MFERIHPYYAVKCNPDKMVIQTLAKCGANFDCASPGEIMKVLDAGVCASRILYANPCKRESDIRFMAKMGVGVTTADSVCELEKLAKHFPDVSVILRIYANDPSAKCVLSNKFGAYPEEWDGLLEKAKALNLRVIGVSFHVGSGACNPEVFQDAIRQARTVIEMGARHGHTMSVVDIGGGFSVSNANEMAASVRNSLEKHMHDLDVQIIAEPGRYFAETIATLYTRIVGVRERRGMRDYFITDSLYGSFNCVLYDHTQPYPNCVDLRKCVDAFSKQNSTIYGPTCDGLDKIVEVALPRLECGDWLRWDNMGAYTIAGACDFNGIVMTAPKCVYLPCQATKI